MGFNPCFNGYSTLTSFSIERRWLHMSSFNPCFNGYSTLTPVDVTLGGSAERVSILVLMDTLL